jgi:SAM-dependent methyltransferase
MELASTSNSGGLSYEFSSSKGRIMLPVSFQTLRRYPANLLSQSLYKLRTAFGMVRAAEKRQELVGPAYLWEMKRDFQIAFLKQQGLKPNHFLLDFGCGVLRGGIPLIAYLDQGRYYGHEVRPAVLEEGRKALAEAGLGYKSPTLASGELRDWHLSESFDFVWAFSVLIHLSDGILEESLGWIAAHLRPGGRLLANVNLDPHTDGEWQGFPVVCRSLEFYGDAAKRCGLRVKSLGRLASLGHVTGSRGQDSQTMLEFSVEK